MECWKHENDLIANRANLFTAANTILMAGFANIPFKNPELFWMLVIFTLLMNVIWYFIGVAQYNGCKYWSSELQKHELGEAFVESEENKIKFTRVNWILCKVLPAAFIAFFVVLIILRRSIYAR